MQDKVGVLNIQVTAKMMQPMQTLRQRKKHTETTRCRPSKGRRCIPDVDIQVHVETYLNDFSSSAQVKIQVKFNFEL